MKNPCSIFTLHNTGEPKIGKLQNELMREQNILGFNISVSVAFGVHVIQSVHHLMEISSGNYFGEFSSIGDKVKQLATANVLKDNGKTLVCRFILFFVRGVLSHVDKADQVLMVKVFHNTELMLKNSEVGRFLFVFFDGYIIAVFVLAEFDSMDK